MAIIKVRNPAIDLDAAEIPNLDANKITTGTIDNARISLDANEIPNLDTAKITTGTFDDARMPSTVLNSNVDLTNLSATNLTSGTVPIARLGTSGTKDATTFLRGDNTFASAGGNMTPAFSVYLSGNQSISDSVYTKVQFNTETLDTDNAFDTSNNEFTVPSGKGGKYFIHMHGYVYGSGSGAMFALNFNLKYTPSGGSTTNHNGLKYYEQSGSLEVARSGSFSGIIDLNDGDKLSIELIISTNGGSANLNQSGTHFCGYKIIE